MKLLSLPTTRDYRLAICPDKWEVAISVNRKIFFWNWLEDRCYPSEWDLNIPWRMGSLKYSPDGSKLAIRHEKYPKEELIDPANTYIDIVQMSNGKVIDRINSEIGLEDFIFPTETQPSRYIEANCDPKTDYHIWEFVDGKPRIDWVLPKMNGYRDSRFYDQGVLQITNEAIHRFSCFSEMKNRTPILSELSTETEKELKSKRKRQSKSSTFTPYEENNWILDLPSTFSFERGQRENALAIHPDGTRLLLGGVGGRVRLWSIDEARELTCWDWPIGYVESVAFSSDGLIAAAVGLRNQAVVWDLEG